jgi:acyl carrier protein
MPHEEIMKKIGEIFREVFDDDSLVITEQTSAKDIEDWDSLMNINLIAAMEDTFGIRFALKEVSDMQCVGDAADIIERKYAGT